MIHPIWLYADYYTECLHEALVSLGFKAKEEVDYDLVKEDGWFHQFVKLRGRDGWIAIDLASSMYMPENIRHIVVAELGKHREDIEYLGKQLNTTEAIDFLYTKALPLQYIFRIISEDRIKLGIEKSLLTSSSISQTAAEVKLLITNL